MKRIIKMKTNLTDDISLLAKLIEGSESICIASHIHPDGDSVGSLLALGLALKSIKGKKITMALTDDIPNTFSFLPGIEFVEENNHDNFDLLITLDCSDLERLGRRQSLVSRSDYLVNIDHHISNLNFGQLNIVDSEASSTGEILYHLIRGLNLKMTTEIATCLYVAISTDTGSFKYQSTTSQTLRIAANLLEENIDLSQITIEIYQNKSKEKTNLFVKGINTIEYFCNNRIGFAYITQQMVKACDAKLQDADDIINFIRDINHIEVACILKEIDQGEVKVGLRSKAYVDVAKIAQHFKGGGHIRAAGCTIYSNIDDAKDQILEEIKKSIR